MIIFKHIIPLQQYLLKAVSGGKTTGFVPTMGALHHGHLTLVAKAVEQTDLVISSIFVNPAQFNDPGDFEKYPVTIEQDVYLLERAGCNVLFLPSVEEIYPAGYRNQPKHYELGYLETILDGSFRPGHFQGVCRVVERLLEIVHPDTMFLGQKDYQQCMVLSRLVALMQTKTRIEICATQREPDGLAMSSRNVRLTASERISAPAIYQSLQWIKHTIVPGSVENIIAAATQQLTSAGFRVDYIAIADADTLELLSHWNGQTPLVALAAAFLGDVRLIDNLLLDGPS